jgi:Helix-turn-helix domain
MSQTQRVLKALETAGPNGISASDFDGSRPVIDGGRQIKRLAARIAELRGDGHEIASVSTKSRGAKFVRYVLRATTAARQVSPVEVVDGSTLGGDCDFDELPLFDEAELEWV